MRRRAHILLATLAGLTSLGLGSGTAGTTDPASSAFSAHVDNPWFPLTPGTTYIYRGVKDGKPARDVLTVTHRTATIDAAPCVVVQDRLYLRGRLSERTTDWYTQDAKGNVWYFGEDTAELDARGHVTSTEGTWHAGVRNARAGIFMPAHPAVGEHHRQEYDKGNAEDEFRVRRLHARITVPYGSFRDVLQTHEFTRLEPGTLDAKYYVRGVGEVLETSIKGPKERAALVDIRHG